MAPLSTGDYTRMADRRDGTQRRCKVCDEWKERTEFYRKSGYTCKPCRNAQIVQRRRETGGDRANSLWSRYRLRVADYDSMLEAQNGVCALCERRKATTVDHDHETGKVRSLLCNACNSALGKLYDDPVLLRKAARYVEGHKPPA